jgi:hypothetical protein
MDTPAVYAPLHPYRKYCGGDCPGHHDRAVHYAVVHRQRQSATPDTGTIAGAYIQAIIGFLTYHTDTIPYSLTLGQMDR